MGWVSDKWNHWGETHDKRHGSWNGSGGVGYNKDPNAGGPTVQRGTGVPPPQGGSGGPGGPGGSGGGSAGGNGLGPHANLPNFNDDRDWISKYLHRSPWQQAQQSSAAQVGGDPYSGQWGSLIDQLQQTAYGNGPSMAQNAYRQASQDTMGSLAGMAQGSQGPGAARQAMIQQGRVGQGMAAGLASARTQEQQGAVSQLGGALAGAGNSAFQRDALNANNQQAVNNLNAQLAQATQAGNQGAWLGMMGAKLGLSAEQLKALLGGQQYDLGKQGQPSDLQGYLTDAAAIAAVIALL